jgi:phycoerythrin-associated linker protein
MDIQEFVANSIGQWKSQRSVHHLAFSHFEAVESEISITPLSAHNPEIIELCKTHNTDPQLAVSPFQMSWRGESDWDDNAISEGTCILVPIPNLEQTSQGKLLRDQGYAETITAAGDYYFTEDGTFVLETPYEHASAAEKIWFINPNVRCRVSLIKTSSGTGVVTASFSSEIRQKIDN